MQTKHTKNTDSPAISTCTTATNLSSYDFGSNHPLIKKQHMEKNLRTVHPEIQALTIEKDVELGTDTPNDVYTTTPKNIYKRNQVRLIN